MSQRADIAFSPSVKAAQQARGSRAGYARATERHDWQDALPPALQDFVHARDSFYLGTVNADGQPYIQHRGGPPGFLTVLDARTLGFADYSGNRQYISVGNLTDESRVHLFLMDYPNRRRLKIWGTAEVVEGADLAPDDPRHAWFDQVLAASPGQPVERLFLVQITAWDLNCPKWITPRYTADELLALRGSTAS